MKTSTKLFIVGAILLILPIPFAITIPIGLACIIGGIAIVVIRSTKEKSSAKPSDYASEARRACEKVTPKQKNTPPWEG